MQWLTRVIDPQDVSETQNAADSVLEFRVEHLVNVFVRLKNVERVVNLVKLYSVVCLYLIQKDLVQGC